MGESRARAGILVKSMPMPVSIKRDPASLLVTNRPGWVYRDLAQTGAFAAVGADLFHSATNLAAPLLAFVIAKGTFSSWTIIFLPLVFILLRLLVLRPPRFVSVPPRLTHWGALHAISVPGHALPAFG